LGDQAEYVAPEKLVAIAEAYRSRGNIGVAFTYNEPLVGYEYVRDAARLIHDKGMKSVMVTNGTASSDILDELLPYIDAMNIDLKGFTDHYYEDVLGGDRQMVMDFIAKAAETCHVELTTLIVPGENDSEEEIREMNGWIAGLPDGEDIPLHISRFFPTFNMTDRRATDVALVYRLAETARESLKYVYTGNC
ncbi:MAG: radical SAM protein, partial [Firmicutes bacterium]|nr:radical SAM protein [Bacillota bacterium]